MADKLLIIKTGSTIQSLRADGEDFELWFRTGCGLQAQQCHVSAVHLGASLPALAEVGGIIVTGSPAYVTDLEAWNFVAADYLRQAYARSTPILGVCYGHQLLAWAFGGEVGFNPRGRAIGTMKVQLTAAAAHDPLMQSMPQSFPAQVSHQQSVLALPGEATLLGSSDLDPHHAFRIGDSSWGIQFHPEFSADICAAYIDARRQDLGREGLNPDRLKSALAASPDSAALLPRFIEIMRQAA